MVRRSSLTISSNGIRATGSAAQALFDAFAKNCQTGRSDNCLASKADGVVCPEDSCDIDDGVRKQPDQGSAE